MKIKCAVQFPDWREQVNPEKLDEFIQAVYIPGKCPRIQMVTFDGDAYPFVVTPVELPQEIVDKIWDDWMDGPQKSPFVEIEV